MTKEELCRLEQPELVKLIDEGQLVFTPRGSRGGMVICPKCKGVANWNSHFNTYVCGSCPWEERSSSGVYYK